MHLPLWLAVCAVICPCPASEVFARTPILLTQLPAGQELSARGDGALPADYGDGSRIVLLQPDGSRRVLTEAFHSACEPNVSFDSQHILFAGKRHAGDAWNIFEMNVDSTEIRQVTREAGNCRDPIYQSTLYTIDSPEPWYQLSYISDAAGTLADDGITRATHLYSCKLDGSELRRLTYNVSSDFDLFLMQDGRILFASSQRAHLSQGDRGRVRLFGINLDGADYALFADPKGQRFQSMPCVTTAGLVLFVEADTVPRDGAGRLAAVHFRRPLHSYHALTEPDQGLFHSPSPLPDGTVLVSRRPADGSGTHAVGRFDPKTATWTPIFDDPDWHDIDACVLAPRDEPDGRSSVVTERDPNGKLYCLNVYTDDLPKQQRMPAGTITRLRVLVGVPISANEQTQADLSTRTLRRILGEIDIQDDGSFQLEVPANTSIELQTVDADGMALRSCGWIWAKNHEPRGCIGCHEDGELTPENRLVDTMNQPAVSLALSEQKRRTVEFRRDIMPIIAAKCVSCHDADGAKPRLTGDDASDVYRQLLSSEDASYGESVERRYVQPGEARNSSLIWHIFGRNTARPWDGSIADRPFQPIPDTGAEPLTNNERRTFVEWIDTGAFYGKTREIESRRIN